MYLLMVNHQRGLFFPKLRYSTHHMNLTNVVNKNNCTITIHYTDAIIGCLIAHANDPFSSVKAVVQITVDVHVHGIRGELFKKGIP